MRKPVVIELYGYLQTELESALAWSQCEAVIAPIEPPKAMILKTSKGTFFIKPAWTHFNFMKAITIYGYWCWDGRNVYNYVSDVQVLGPNDTVRMEFQVA